MKASPIAPSRIGAAFARARDERRTALVPFLTAGYPTLRQSEELILATIRGGADIVEIGVPFSDPLADGATVQRTSQVALANGVRLADCLELVFRLRAAGVTTPFVFMGYYNPILQYGIETFASDAAAAGLDGAIVPDLPAEESDDLLAAFRRHGRDLIFLLAPTSTEARIEDVAERATGFVYCVSLTGVTGGRRVLPDLSTYLHRVRSRINLPIAIGFGISTPEHVRQVGDVAEGAVIGSALIDAIDESPPDEQPATAEAFLRHLATGADRPQA
ncbi:MAG: Tryptophan synthase alpha chain [uncultured Thermomicrobiales bacterium]|uniref:Tryptophan synthase alpha chain n=1 Tax=uncultured Thermomicrobiales bacterium TaxID=1645740 RepID=A0A6J4V2Q8_9BACT|nr:MAG: Tryptophan synthase alpha chain [uncultured Thermomicrobiales bacterium]